MKKILLLDDNLDILQVVEEVLHYERFDVKTTTSSRHFIKLAKHYLPDLIILDYKLADGNGGELCRAIKADPVLMRTLVILFSAYISPELNFFDFGCDEVIAKPFDLDILLEKVQRLTGLNISSDTETVERH